MQLTVIGEQVSEISFKPARERLRFWSLNRLLLSLSLLILIGVAVWSVYLVKSEARKEAELENQPKEMEMVATANTEPIEPKQPQKNN